MLNYNVPRITAPCKQCGARVEEAGTQGAQTRLFGCSGAGSGPSWQTLCLGPDMLGQRDGLGLWLTRGCSASTALVPEDWGTWEQLFPRVSGCQSAGACRSSRACQNDDRGKKRLTNQDKYLSSVWIDDGLDHTIDGSPPYLARSSQSKFCFSRWEMIRSLEIVVTSSNWPVVAVSAHCCHHC